MKRIIVILAALAVLMSACINFPSPPVNELDPIVTLVAPATAPVGEPVTIDATVADFEGELDYRWSSTGFSVAGSGASGGFGSGGFLLSHTSPGVENGAILGPQVTYRFDGGQVPFGDETITMYDDHNVLVRGGESVYLAGGESVTATTGELITLIGANTGGISGDVLTSVRFTAEDQTIDLAVGEPQVVELAGYAATLELIDSDIVAGEIANVTVQATYTYEECVLDVCSDLTQQQQVRLTPTSGVRITLPEGESVEAYLIGGTFSSGLDGVAIDVMGEVQTLSIGDIAVLEGLPIYVVSGSGTEGVEEDAQVRLHVGGAIAKFDETITVAEPEGVRTVPAVVTAGESSVVVQHEGGGDLFVDPILGLYEYRLYGDDLYRVDRFAVELLHVGEYLELVPKTRTLFSVSLTVSDDSGNSDSDSASFITA